MDWLIVPDSDMCASETEGEMTVAVVVLGDDGAMSHDSCWPSIDAAAAHINEMAAQDIPDDTDEEMPAAEPVAPEGGAEMFVSVRVDGMDELERAAGLADRVSNALGLLSALKEATFETVEHVAQPVEFGPIDVHSTGFSDDPYDGPAEEVKVRSPESESYFANIYAWRDDNADTSVKAAYRFIHHFVGSDGEAGGASVRACSAGIGVLNGGRGGTTIPDGDRQGVYNHLARHLRDAGREAPVLMSQEAYELALAESNAELAEELVTPVAEGGLAGLEDDALIAELARRWASGLAEKLREEPATEVAEMMAEMGDDSEGDEPVIDIDVEITVSGLGEKDSEPCPMCESEGTVSVNGLSATCPMCGGEGVMPPMDDDVPAFLMMNADGEQVVADGEELADGAVTDIVSPYDWEGVLIVEGIPSGDGRMIAENGLTWRELPIPLMLQTVNASGHDGAVIAGSIHEIERQGQNIVGRGFFDSGTAGQEARRLLSEGTMRGVSADIDSVMVSYETPLGEEAGIEDVLFGTGEALEVLTAGRIMGATLTPFPAFQEAFVTVLMPEMTADDEVLVASGAEVLGAVWRVPSRIGMWVAGAGDAAAELEVLVASAGQSVEVPVNPPREWFVPGVMTEPVPFTVHADGRCYGLVAQWGTCHIGFTDRCQQVPRTGSAYRHFRNKTVLTAEGDLIATGPVFMDTVHPNLRLVASDAQAFYADTGCAVADVALYENEHGIVAAGALRPGLTPEQVRRFRGSDVSPDWRSIGGRLEVVGLLSVNVSGFIVEGLVASGASSAPRGAWDSVSGEVTALVAAGMVRRAESETERVRFEVEALRAEVAELREALRPMRAERAAASLLRTAVFGVGEAHGCGCEPVDGGCACEV